VTCVPKPMTVGVRRDHKRLFAENFLCMMCQDVVTINDLRASRRKWPPQASMRAQGATMSRTGENTRASLVIACLSGHLRINWIHLSCVRGAW
jgi:hypothetical protein